MHTGTKYSPWFLSQQEIFLQLCVAQFLAVSLQENAESLVTLKPVYHVRHFVVFIGIRLEEPQ